MHSKRNHTYRILALIATPLLLTTALYILQHTGYKFSFVPLQGLVSRQEEAQCPVDLTATNACVLVRDGCPDFDSDGLIPYLRIYACTSRASQSLLLLLMSFWLVVLFASMATAAAEYLAVHLEFIVRTLEINENLAGVTIFAFGNGCTDLFSTLGELFSFSSGTNIQ